MIPRLVRWQLIVFVIISVVAIVYAGATYARLDKLGGIGLYTVHADFRDSGGIFENAEVTYQGVPVGRVGSLQLQRDGVRVNLELDSDGPRIPASAQAVVANRTAIGEQFVDLRPAGAGGPYLADGSVISNTSIPTPVEEVVASAVDLTDSVPVDDLRTVVGELGKALGGRGHDLDSLIRALSNLARSGNDNLPETVALIRNAKRALGTQADDSDAILDWSRNLDLITAQLARSDPDVRRLLTTGQTSATQLSALLERSGGDMTAVIRNAANDVRAVSGTFPGVSPALSLLSALSSGSYSPAPGDGTIHFGVVLETNNPPSCTVGYESTRTMIDAMKRTNPDLDLDYDDYPFNMSARCAVPQGNPTDVRGAQNAEFSDPSVSQPWDRTSKKDPDKLALSPVAQQLAALLGVRPR